MNRRAEPWADCIIIFGVRRYCAIKEHRELFWYPGTYDFARGLALDGHSLLSAASAEWSGGRVLPFLDPLVPLVGVAFLFFPPPHGGGEASSSSSSPSWEECALESSDEEYDTTRRRELFRVPVVFFLAFFSGTT